MALLGASFQIGRSALAAYQAAIATCGQNIANLGNPNYTRLTGRLQALEGGFVGGVAPGGGVNLSALQRHVDQALEARLRGAIGALASAQSTAETLGEIETIYHELTEYDLSTELTRFFNSFGDLQNEPDETTTRNLVLSGADAVVQTLRRQRGALLEQANGLDNDIRQSTRRANEIAGEIANLNELIVVQESRGSGYSAPLRDRRDGLLRELSELMEIDVRERENGSINVYVGSEPLVEFSRSRGLKVETVLEDGLEQATVRFADSNGTVLVRGGKLGAELQARDAHLIGQVQALDQLARGLIYEVNRAHSQGRGLIGYTHTTGSYAVHDTTAALNSTAAGLPFPLENGSFVVHVRGETGEEITRLIEVDLDGIGPDTSLEDLQQQLNDVPGLTATLTADGRLDLQADDGAEFSFSEDSSGALAALGLGNLFEGVDAATIDLKAEVRADSRLLAASLSGAAGDGENAGRLALLGAAASRLLGGQSIQDFQAGMVNTVATHVSAANTAHEAADTVYSSLLAQRESVSGVSLDEEAINLTKFERAFEGAARFLSVVDSLTLEVLSLVR